MCWGKYYTLIFITAEDNGVKQRIFNLSTVSLQEFANVAQRIWQSIHNVSKNEYLHFEHFGSASDQAPDLHVSCGLPFVIP